MINNSEPCIFSAVALLPWGWHIVPTPTADQDDCKRLPLFSPHACYLQPYPLAVLNGYNKWSMLKQFSAFLLMVYMIYSVHNVAHQNELQHVSILARSLPSARRLMQHFFCGNPKDNCTTHVAMLGGWCRAEA